MPIITEPALSWAIHYHQSTLDTIKQLKRERKIKMALVLACMLEDNLDELLKYEVITE